MGRRSRLGKEARRRTRDALGLAPGDHCRHLRPANPSDVGLLRDRLETAPAHDVLTHLAIGRA
eukprot:5496203-Pyramimonas_sp.AAC.1